PSIVSIIVTTSGLTVPCGLNAQRLPHSLTRYVQSLVLVNGIFAEGIRLKQLRTGAGLDGYLIRSASSLTSPLSGRGWLHAALIAPEYYSANNSAIPFSVND